MAKRFIVGLDESTAEQNEKFKQYIDEQGLAWWHWIDNFWLLKDSSETLNSEVIRDELGEIYPNVHKIVIELKGDSINDTWSGYGPSGEKRNMFDWLHNTWSK